MLSHYKVRCGGHQYGTHGRDGYENPLEVLAVLVRGAHHHRRRFRLNKVLPRYIIHACCRVVKIIMYATTITDVYVSYLVPDAHGFYCVASFLREFALGRLYSSHHLRRIDASARQYLERNLRLVEAKTS